MLGLQVGRMFSYQKFIIYESLTQTPNTTLTLTHKHRK